ncbi:MAG: hypothetical protein IJ092_03740 [Atopobiaceae bacterium]|nr:hypothetical protein [Atopobiaceae bacterium]MBR1828589.1 hypothetical protein [Atopobiaceae bacterium]
MQKPARKLLALGIAASLAYGTLLAAPTIAFAATDAELAAEIERCSLEFADAQEKVDGLMVQIEENEGRLAEIEAVLPAQRERTFNSVRTLYKFHQSGGDLIDLVLSADDFNQFLTMVQYLDIIQTHNYEEIDRLVQLQDELSIVSATLDAQRQEAESERDRAAEALAEAEAAREEARQAALARAFAEAQQRQAAVEEARAHEGETFTTASGNEVQVQAPTSDDVTNGASSQEQQQQEAPAEQVVESAPAAPTVDSREQYISTWAARIDAFNAGWPLAGYGRTFAEAAYDYGVDPRWSPAIARMESSSGTYCFASHNAWGWGDVDWPDWDTAIRSHVRGLAAGYGYTLTWDAAQTYCPPNASYWYSAVSSCMYQIWGSDSL